MSLRVLRLFPLTNVTTSSSFLTRQIDASREWSRRTMAHSHTEPPAPDAHKKRHGKKRPKKSGPLNLTPSLSRMPTVGTATQTPHSAPTSHDASAPPQSIKQRGKVKAPRVAKIHRNPSDELPAGDAHKKKFGKKKPKMSGPSNLIPSLSRKAAATSISFKAPLVYHNPSNKLPARDAHGKKDGRKKPKKSGHSNLTPSLSKTAGATSISFKAPLVEKTTVLSDKQEQEQREDADLTGTVPGYTYFDPELNNYEPTHTDFFVREPPIEDNLKQLSSKDLSSKLNTVNIEASLGRSLRTPTSEGGLYQNLIHVLRTRTTQPPLAALVDYHLLFPDHHSTKSYNLLILLSLHHRAYGTTQTLFRAMRDRSIRHNMETHQLHVRWLIYQGFWDKAWSYAMGLMNNFPGDGTQFPIWLEFCHTRKGPMTVENAYNPGGKRLQNASEPVSLISARRNIMNINRPLSIPELKDTPPAGMRNLVHLMIKSRLKNQALKLTEDYFRALPVKMDNNMNHRCLEIVKLHLAAHGIRKESRPRFNAVKKLLFTLLSLNPSLRPTSETLLFILGILKKAKRCGKTAWDFIALCKERWGPEVEDARVRRRVTRLALKEGRMDIVETTLRAESIDNSARRLRLLEHKAVGDSIPRPRVKFLHRPSIRRIYPRNGREYYMWRCLRVRVRRTIRKRIALGRVVTKTQARKYTAPLRLLGKQLALNRQKSMLGSIP